MPFYEYKCAQCDHVFSLLQKRDAEREGYTCPECHSRETARIFSSFAGGGSRQALPVVQGGGGHSCGGGCCCHH